MAKYAVSDLHGRYDLFQKIKDFIKPEDTVCVLGDCGDRGKDGWEIIKEVYTNPQFVYIKGNHEDMLVEAMKTGDKSLCFYNGGKPTYTAWRYKDGGQLMWAHRLDNLPLEVEYINRNGQRIIMCHAGYTPHVGNQPLSDDLLWDRHHFNAQWDMDYVDTFMIHGHTPIPYMDEYLRDAPKESKVKPGVFWYCPDDKGKFHKCNIDCGAVFTGHTALLNLDTFEQHIFKAEDCIYED